MRMGMQVVHQLALAAIIMTVLLTCGVVHVRGAAAATYYVATTGNDANPGTQTQPFQTIGKGLSVLTAGDTLYLRGGTYAERISSNQQTIPTGTSWSNPVTISAYPGDTVTLQPGPGSNVLVLAHAYIQYVIFDGLIFDAANIGGTIEGVSILNGANHIRIKNGEVKNAPGQGIATIIPAATSAFNEFINLKVHDNGSARGNQYGHGMYIESANNVIDGCEVYNNAGYGIQIYNGYGQRADNNVLRNNSVHNNHGDGGVTINHGNNILFYNNLVYSNNGGGVSGICYGNPTNTQVYNNTIYGNGGTGIQVCAGVTSTQVKNNILYQNGSAISDSGIGTVMSNNLIIDPKFVDPSTANFHLQSTSPAIDAGVTLSTVRTDFNGTPRPQGAVADIGAYEFLAGQVPSPTSPGPVPSPTRLRALSILP